jgi:hypothetical protein
MPPFLPQNPLSPPRPLDFSPLTNALDANRQNALAASRQALEAQALDLKREQVGMQQRKFERDEKAAQVQSLGRRAQAIAELPENDPRRARAWQAILREHPEAAKLDPVWHDPVQGPKMLIAEAGEWMDPLKRQLLQAQAAQAQAGVENIPLQRDLLQAQIAQAKQKDAMAEMQARVLAEVFPGLRPQTSQPAAPPPQAVPQAGPGGAALQPMSDTGAPADPLLHPAQAALPPPETPPGVADRLTPAQRQAMGLALIGKGDAGKILLEADNANKLDKEAKNQVEKDLVAATNQLGRLDDIANSYRERFQTLEGKIKNRFNSWVDYLGFARKSMNPKDRQDLAEFTAFRRDAFENLNRYIKEITGAQMSEAEAQRLMRAMPNPGVGLFDGDSPTEFKAKMDSVVRQTKLAYARMSYLRKNGFEGNADAAAKALPLERMPGLIQQRTNSILQEMRQLNPGARQEDLAPLIRRRLRSEFGISA